MLRYFFLLLLSTLLSVQHADSQVRPIAAVPISSSDETLLRLQKEFDLLKSSNEDLRLRLEDMAVILDQQTQVLEKITSKLGINSDSDLDDGKNNGFLNPRYPRSCVEATTVNSQSGIYSIEEPSFSAEAFPVYCNTEEQGGGWTVIQRRVDDSVDFYLDWASYKVGFGNLTGNFFIGLDKLHALTNPTPQELLITLTDFENVTKYAKYDSFAIGDESELYALNELGKYSGDAGDSLTYHAYNVFSTKDKDDATKGNCAVLFKGAWWYRGCQRSNLNGLYLGGCYPDDKLGQGIDWSSWHGHNYSLKTVNMMIRPKNN